MRAKELARWRIRFEDLPEEFLLYLDRKGTITGVPQLFDIDPMVYYKTWQALKVQINSWIMFGACLPYPFNVINRFEVIPAVNQHVLLERITHLARDPKRTLSRLLDNALKFEEPPLYFVYETTFSMVAYSEDSGSYYWQILSWLFQMLTLVLVLKDYKRWDKVRFDYTNEERAIFPLGATHG